MSQKDVNIRRKWKFEFLNSEKNIVSVYWNFFNTTSIPDVKFEIFSGILNQEEFILVLSKTPYTPTNATIKIQVIENDFVDYIYQKHFNSWTDSCIIKCNLSMNRQNSYSMNTIVNFEYQCDITWHGYDESQPPERNIIYSSLEHFLTATDFSDMVIVIGEKEISVHKIVLAAYSPVFLAMFQADMTESLNKRIDITDIEAEIMEMVINFMYTGVIHPVPDIDVLSSILGVADKYEITTLKKWCEKKLSEKIRIENVLEILDKTSLYEIPQLRQTIMSFMVKNKSIMISLEGFADLHNRKPELLIGFINKSITKH